MKKIALLAVVPLFALMAFNTRAVPLGASGTATFTVTAFAQEYSGVTASVRTNHTTTTTNVTTITKSKATNAPIDSKFVLRLLANSFKTNFPTGAKLIMSGVGAYSFFVVDSSGSNILLDASSVLSIVDNVSVNSGISTFIATTTRTATKYSGNNTQAFTEYVTLTYDDATLTTTDGTHTNFQLSGILADMYSENVRTAKTTESVTLHGAGTGTIQGKTNIILKGTITATLSGILEV